MEKKLENLVEGFRENSVRAGKTLRDLAAADSARFCDSALRFLRTAGLDTPGHQYLATLLVMNELLPERLCNPSIYNLRDSVELARTLVKAEPLLDAALARRLLIKDGPEPGKLDGAVAERTLEVLAVISDGIRILPFVAQLLSHPNPRIRSKATLLVGRSNKNTKWAEQRMAEADPRVRANTIEALWGVDSEGARAVLWEAAKDSHNRVQGNALMGLYRLGEMSVIRLILDMASHPEPRFRSTAAWVMGETGDPRFLPVLTQMVKESGAKPLGAVLRAITRIKKKPSGAADGQPLRVGLCQVKRLEDGSRRLRASVATSEGIAFQNLLPTQFIVWEDGGMICDYSVQRCREPKLFAAGIAVPSRKAPPSDLDEAVEQALGNTLALKRASDRWALLQYTVIPPPPPAAGPPVAAPADALQAAPAPPADARNLCQCTGDSASLWESILKTGSRGETASSSLEAIRSLLSSVAAVRGSRNLIILADRLADNRGAAPGPADIDMVVKSAYAAVVAVHGIGLPGPDAAPAGLRDICERTGGSFLVAETLERIAPAFEKLYLGLLYRYEILYKCQPGRESSDPQSVRLQVLTEDASGEDSLG